MSWSCSFVGTPSSISKALDAHGEKLTGKCKMEFDAAKPAIQTLLNQNMDNNGPSPALQLVAFGIGYWSNDILQRQSCTVKLEPLNGQLV